MQNLTVLIAAIAAAMIAGCASAPKPASTPETLMPVKATTIQECAYYQFADQTVEFLANQEACCLTQETIRVYVEPGVFSVRKAGLCSYNKEGLRKILKIMDADRDCVISAKEEKSFEWRVVTTLLASGKTGMTGPEAFQIVFPNGN